MSYFHSEISIPSNTNKKLRLDAHDGMENDYTFIFPAQTGENNSIMAFDENNAASWTKDISINDISAVNFDISYVNAKFIDVSAIHANNINVPNITLTNEINAANVNASSINVILDISAANVTAVSNVNTSIINLSEKAVSENSVAGKGQLWVKNSTPNELYFTNDNGNDIQITKNSGINNGINNESFGPNNFQTINNSTTINLNNYNPINRIMIKMCGGGGGGGGAGNANDAGDAGGGGGAGEYVEVYLSSTDISNNSGSAIYCEIGSGGTGGSGNTKGLSGENTIIKWNNNNGNIIATAVGGGGGWSGNHWGSGGIGGFTENITFNNGVIGYNLPGGNGIQGRDTFETNVNLHTGGNGGNSHLGRGGLGAVANGRTPADAPSNVSQGGPLYGGGGGGGLTAGSGSSKNSSNGASGVVFVYFY